MISRMKLSAMVAVLLCCCQAYGVFDHQLWLSIDNPWGKKIEFEMETLYSAKGETFYRYGNCHGNLAGLDEGKNTYSLLPEHSSIYLNSCYHDESDTTTISGTVNISPKYQGPLSLPTSSKEQNTIVCVVTMEGSPIIHTVNVSSSAKGLITYDVLDWKRYTVEQQDPKPRLVQWPVSKERQGREPFIMDEARRRETEFLKHYKTNSGDSHWLEATEEKSREQGDSKKQ